MTAALPQSLTRATWVLVGLVGVGGIAAVLTVVREDDLVRSWAEHNPSVRPTYRQGGLEAVRDSSVEIPDFAPVAIVLFLVMAGLALSLLPFLRAGYSWARTSLMLMVVFTALATVAGVRTDPPTIFEVLGVVAILLGLVLIVLLYRPDANAYLREQRSHVRQV